MGEQFQRANALQVTDHQAIKGRSAAQAQKGNLVKSRLARVVFFPFSCFFFGKLTACRRAYTKSEARFTRLCWGFTPDAKNRVLGVANGSGARRTRQRRFAVWISEVDGSERQLHFVQYQ